MQLRNNLNEIWGRTSENSKLLGGSGTGSRSKICHWCWAALAAEAIPSRSLVSPRLPKCRAVHLWFVGWNTCWGLTCQWKSAGLWMSQWDFGLCMVLLLLDAQEWCWWSTKEGNSACSCLWLHFIFEKWSAFHQWHPFWSMFARHMIPGLSTFCRAYFILNPLLHHHVPPSEPW